ncbi:hypothetical protein CK203_110846 [Vitis vinifera]|uniref:Retrotransposon Copia-like N-terminal domain-containing protein n=1 Tax=Vitis vinifera TaxID=29760 RepID=A0A438C9E9_VITVI|nr:hypothetical protein CK203_110846 [Vitis vinifera]
MEWHEVLPTIIKLLVLSEHHQPTNDLLSAIWARCNSTVTSWILNSVSRDIANSLLYIDNAMEIWGDLSDRFHQNNGP